MNNHDSRSVAWAASVACLQSRTGAVLTTGVSNVSNTLLDEVGRTTRRETGGGGRWRCGTGCFPCGKCKTDLFGMRDRCGCVLERVAQLQNSVFSLSACNFVSIFIAYSTSSRILGFFRVLYGFPTCSVCNQTVKRGRQRGKVCQTY